jgi:transcriptional regulator with XRE-family HTH domain
MDKQSTVSLGEKIKYFRKRAMLSQMKLEIEIGAAAGSISRIEAGEVNPSKETLKKIKEALGLNTREFRYLALDTAQPATQKEIAKAIDEVRHYFDNTKRLAYLVDDRQRIVYASEGFHRSMNISHEQANQAIFGKSTLEITVNPEIGVQKYLDPNDLERIVYYALIRFNYLLGFMKGDSIFEETMNVIKKFPLASKQYLKAFEETSVERLNSEEARTLGFKLMGFTVNMMFSVEQLARSDRFTIYEYAPTNKLLKLLSKL